MPLPNHDTIIVIAALGCFVFASVIARIAGKAHRARLAEHDMRNIAEGSEADHHSRDI
jgi:hypothetical protein